MLFLSVGLGMVGFLDDFIKIRKQRSLGLRSKAKIAGQSIVAVVFALLALQFPDERASARLDSPSPSCATSTALQLPRSCWS